MFGSKKYKIGDKITFWDDPSTEYEIISKKGEKAMNEHQPQNSAEFKEFTQPANKKINHPFGNLFDF